MNKKQVEGFISLLGSPAAGAAWKDFIDQYAPLIFSVARQFDNTPQGQNDCFLYICERLADDDYRRLKNYRADTRSKFTTWLRAVASNLGIDWHRSKHGRYRTFRSMQDLSILDRDVFQFRFEQGVDFSTCLNHLVQIHPGLNERKLSEIISQLQQKLSPRQHWILSVRKTEFAALDGNELPAATEYLSLPESALADDQLAAKLALAIKQLKPDQQLLIKLRFQQGLSIKQISSITSNSDPQNCRYQIKKALDRLSKLLKK